MNDFCTAIREEVTELLLLGKPLPAPLARHVASCEGCSEEAEGVRRVVRTFERADSLRVPSALPDAGRTSAGVPSRKRVPISRRMAAGVSSLVLAACAAFVTIVATSGNDSHTSVAAIQVAQDGEMIAHPWGTEIPVSLSGMRDGTTYRFMTGNARGDRVQAGSVQPSGQSDGPMRVHLTTAMRKDTITMVYVQDADGQFVAQAAVGPHRSS
ncbi:MULTISPECIES: hypothetical protein [unclassified Streptomyces]|uniref:hypothetical protein n=2 Tax=Streptomyces TaxID=1883 RepID=UPI001BB02903|nr:MULTISPECIES: hypothetical protein [unclassified Streptomyces]MDH6455323.1 hypothetical protein [Streptomyces sp. SAI-119]MDH6494124.1 hypothetical protein [Streptomyces sp. SAI-149]